MMFSDPLQIHERTNTTRSSCQEKFCLRCLKHILEKMTSKRYLEDVLLKHLKDIST